jgi:hypothetical protein
MIETTSYLKNEVMAVLVRNVLNMGHTKIAELYKKLI